MKRLAINVALILLLCGCTSTVDRMQQGAQEVLRQTLASHFSRQLGNGIDLVINELATEGGYLDNPLVRILMPPPLGMVVDVARDFYQDPQAALVETLMNRAAEQAIPGAGPILQGLLTSMEAQDAQGLLSAGQTAATDYLRDRAGAAIHDALLPVVDQKLADSGATKLYGELLGARTKAGELAIVVPGSPPIPGAPVSAEGLPEYVASQAVEGLFKRIGAREKLIRDSLPMP